MKQYIKNKDGITLITLVVAVIIMVTITSILAINAEGLFETDRLNKMYEEINSLHDASLLYYSENGELPSKGAYNGTNVTFISSDQYRESTYYIIDANKIDNITLKYGKRKLFRY